jgi:hypothetical protein
MTTQLERAKNQRIIENIEKFDVHTGYTKLDEFILLNPNLTTREYVKYIDFHQFTEESFEYLISKINKHRLTWGDIGPFIENVNGTWYNDKSNKSQTIENLLKENIELKKQNKELTDRNSNLLTILEKSKISVS